MTTKKTFLLIAALYVFGYITHALYLGKTVYGDGIYYFSWLHSIVIDRNVRFNDEYAYFGAVQPMTPSGIMGNKYSIGPALLWSPSYLLVHALLHGSGYEFPYQLAAGMTTVLCTVFGLVLLYRVLPVSETVRIPVVLLLAFATNLYFYGSVDPVNSHGLTFFAAALYLSFLYQKNKNWLLVGASLGLIGIIRLQDIVYGLLVIPYFISDSRKNAWKFFPGFLTVFSLQLFAWRSVYGTIMNPYLSGGEGFALFEPHILTVLFSPVNGLFLWTPAVFLGAVGLFTRPVNRLVAAVFMLQLIIVSTWSTWSQGASFSGRMFVGSLPIVAFGISRIIQKLMKLIDVKALYYILLAPLSAVNVSLMIFFLLRK